MNLFIFVLFEPLFGYLSDSDKCSCYYDSLKKITVCNKDCSDSLIEEDRLFKCPSQRFRQRLPLWQWLLEEMFCIFKDNRKDESEQYTESESVSYDNPSSFSATSDSLNSQLNFGSKIFLSNGSQFRYPTISLSSSECKNNGNPKYLIPTSSTCYYKADGSGSVQAFINLITNSSIFIYPNISINPIKCFFDNNTNISNCEDLNCPISVNIIFKFNDQMEITEAQAVIRAASNESLSIYPFSVNINYVNENQPTSMKSGPFGYSYGEPVLTQSNGVVEPFPVPYGIDSIKYTPLLFGVDTISGIPKTNNEFNINSFSKFLISKLAQANATYKEDWIEIHNTDEPNQYDFNMVYLEIHYAFIGNVDNPQNIIYDAKLQYSYVVMNPGLILFKCAFLKSANNPSYRYLQPRPRIKGIPTDTFYPF